MTPDKHRSSSICAQNAEVRPGFDSQAQLNLKNSNLPSKLGWRPAIVHFQNHSEFRTFAVFEQNDSTKPYFEGSNAKTKVFFEMYVKNWDITIPTTVF